MKLIKQDPPDFISLDLIMPKKSGHRLLYELKRDKQLSRIPVLIVTAHASDDLGKGDLQDLMDKRVMSGPGTYLEKPVNPLSYVRSIQRALGIEETKAANDRAGFSVSVYRRISPSMLRLASCQADLVFHGGANCNDKFDCINQRSQHRRRASVDPVLDAWLQIISNQHKGIRGGDQQGIVDSLPVQIFV